MARKKKTQRKKKRVKKAPPLNRQEPWFLGRDYSTTSFTQLHQVNKYNHAVEGLEVLRNYTGRQNELDRRINEQNGKQDDLYKRVAQAERLAQGVARNYKRELAAEKVKHQGLTKKLKDHMDFYHLQLGSQVDAAETQRRLDASVAIRDALGSAGMLSPSEARRGTLDARRDAKQSTPGRPSFSQAASIIASSPGYDDLTDDDTDDDLDRTVVAFPPGGSPGLNTTGRRRGNVVKTVQM